MMVMGSFGYSVLIGMIDFLVLFIIIILYGFKVCCEIDFRSLYKVGIWL